ncbi:HEPN domain-containing protein [Pseudomonas sp. GM17]|uniref:HEPN domain-containing protein n=1 Tax=Pseudomonas sp. GM17 TaxID=1144323 RepID=UPI0002727206|nr:HEPN domain-containing protein [Pseudomonas sp. GM17]WIE52601.1 HEPN domain-containing protein [Pseudomonas sp. GM17]
MTAKDELLSRLEYLSAAKDLPEIIDKGIARDTHNGVANLLRKGLAIVVFNILEDYIKKRTTEALKRISSSGIGFDKLPPKLQDASILDALTSLAFKAKLDKKDNNNNWRGLIQSEALKIHSTGNNVFELSEFSLASSSSNISPDDITNILNAFGITGGWNTLKKISDSIGGGLPDLSQSYKNAASRRHSCAHEANFNYNYSWLSSIKGELLAIAASLDIALEARCRQVENSPHTIMSDHALDQALNYRFLHNTNSQYKELLKFNGASRKNWTDLSTALLQIRPRLGGNNEFLVVLDEKKSILDWHVS